MRILLVIAMVFFVLIVSGCVNNNLSQRNESQNDYGEMTYDECAENILKDIVIYGPASEEPIGAQRTDGDGRIWIKSDEINQFDFDGNPIPGAYAWKSDQSPGSLLTNEAVDSFPGGANYVPEIFPECLEYIGNRDSTKEEVFREIVNTVIQEQFQNGVTFSIEEIQVISLAGKTQGFIKLNCNDDINYETEEDIIESISNKLSARYPKEYSEGYTNPSWTDVHCNHGMGWRISEGYYGPLI